MFISETETIIKKILPYLVRRGYDLATDFKYEESTILDTEYKKGFIDILVTLGRKTPYFLIEAKRDGTKISAKHKEQALSYGRSKKCLFVAITNGQNFELLNTSTSSPLKLNGSAFNKIPKKGDLVSDVLSQLKKNPKTDNLFIKKDNGLPFRPGLPLSKLNHLIQQCHNSIRKIEKNEEHAFSDFSKILFLKLLEEKWEREDQIPPYTYVFHELAEVPAERADQVKSAINTMIDKIKSQTKFGDVLNDPIKLKQNKTYLSIVKKVSSVTWNDCNLDSKGTAFEYFVRATLKGKKLGQYFTPRALVQLMLHLGRYRQIIGNLQANEPFKVLDPSCGTGGFLVYAMNSCLVDISSKLKSKDIHHSLALTIIRKLKEDTFFGIDAHDGVASSAKMNMIIAGDGHNNIKCADSLKLPSLLDNYSYSNGKTSNKAHLILTNPPFGTSEGESLSQEDQKQFKIKSYKGQSLFIQKMINTIELESRIVTVIDEGVLNTFSYRDLRKYIFEECKIEYVVSLPDETFKPNKINVKSSVLVLKKRTEADDELEDELPVIYIKIHSLGYDSAGDEIRNFKLNDLIKELEVIDTSELSYNQRIEGYNWVGFIANSQELVKDANFRIDYKFWDLNTTSKINSIIKKKGCKTIKDLNLIETKRGNSPSASEYVSEEDGHALVIKAGSNISKTGLILTKGDFIELAQYQTYLEKKQVLIDGDILLSSTGEGTLGKCAVYRNNSKAAIADSHVTVIRVNQEMIHPEYLCDYLRKGFGRDQITRLYTGATGLIEITPEDVNSIVIPPLPSLGEQKKISKKLRAKEYETELKLDEILANLMEEEQAFYNNSY